MKQGGAYGLIAKQRACRAKIGTVPRLAKKNMA
jgi:hypothetical protein